MVTAIPVNGTVRLSGRVADPAHAWLRARIAEIAAELDRAAPAV
jgi:hypothetical protein